MSLLDKINQTIKLAFTRFGPFAAMPPAPYFDPPIPQARDEIPDYRISFQSAVEFTRSCGFTIPDVTWLDQDFLLEGNTVAERAFVNSGVTSWEGATGQCLKWSHFLAPFTAQAAGCAAWLTLGQIWKQDGPIFGPSWTDLRRWSEGGIQLPDFRPGGGYNLHAWITLQSGEIIDPTYLHSLSVVMPGCEGLSGSIASGRDPHVVREHRYLPMAVGSEFAEALASRLVMVLLADTAPDLQRREAVAVFT